MRAELSDGPPLATPERELLLRTIETLERQRRVLGSETIDSALAPLRAKLAGLDGRNVAAPLPARTAERKVVTVLFADIAGFTAMSERIGSEATMDIVNALFDRLVPVIERYGGTIDKFIGDEIMAVFGAPNAAERHVAHALRAALDMFDALAAFNRDRALAIGLHIGINSGPVVAGEIGSLARRDYSVTGDVVNVAARLEGIAASGEALVGPSTFRHALAEFEFETLPALALKGKSRAISVYRLLGARTARRREAADGVELAFSGRTRELEALLTRVGANAAKPSGTIGIVADPGVGKSRLLAEFQARADATVRWVEASAYDHRSDVSYGVLHEVLDALVGVPTDADRADLTEAYREFLDALPWRQADVRSYILRLRGLPLDDAAEAELAAIPAAALRERMTSAAAAFISGAAADRTMVIRVEDLHWADVSSVELLRALAKNPRLARVLIVFTTRPDPGPAREWIEQLRAGGNGEWVVDLRPLSDDVVTALLERTFGGDATSLALREQIRAKAQGNPFYLVSFLRSLVDEGIAEVRDGGLRVTGSIASLAVPESLHAAVGARIDRLPASAKQVLRWASLLGRVFAPAHVEAIARSEAGSGDVDRSLSLLVERQLVEADLDGRMRFVHAVVQDVAYEGMLERDRRRLHGKAARFLATLASDASEADMALLAWHHERAGEHAAASLRYEQASKLAAKSHANREEIQYLESALRLAAGDDGRVPVLSERLGDVLQITGRYADACERFAAIALPAQPGSLDAVRIRRKIAKTWTSRQRFDEANAAIAEVRALLAGIGCARSDDAWWREHFALELFAMWSMYMQARIDALVDLVDRLAPEVERHATLAERGLFHRSVALLELRRTRYRPEPSTVALAAQAADELRRAGDVAELGLATFGHAFAQLWSGAVAEADASLQQVLRDTTRVGDAERSMLCLTYLAVTARMLHDVDRAEAFARAALAAAAHNGSSHYEGVAHANLAWVAWRRGDGGGADGHVESARRLCQLHGYPFNWLHLLVALARALEAHDYDEAVACVRSMAEESQQDMRGGMKEALAATTANATPQAMAELLVVSIEAGYA